MSRVHLPVVTVESRPGPVPRDPLLDTFARRIRYLRVSVTDRCNYRCTYCMPESLEDRMQFQPRSALLTFEELEQIVGVFAGLGVRKIRLTGGEPTVRHGIVDLVRRMSGVPGIEQVVMTTNGHLLADLAEPLRAAGLSAINVSVDTLDAEQFRTLTGRGDLGRVLAGIDAAVAAGLQVKTNAVALAGINDGEVVALCEDAWRRGAVPRFIEHMPMSDGAIYEAARGLSAAVIRRTVEAALGPLVAADAAEDRPRDPGPSGLGGLGLGLDRGSRATGPSEARDPGPARYWSLAADPSKQVGIISAMTEHFCDDCNRLRLTATGELHACLGHDDAVSLRDVLRGGGSQDDLVKAIAGAVSGKRAGHIFEDKAPTKHMIGIGG